MYNENVTAPSFFFRRDEHGSTRNGKRTIR